VRLIELHSSKFTCKFGGLQSSEFNLNGVGKVFFSYISTAISISICDCLECLRAWFYFGHIIDQDGVIGPRNLSMRNYISEFSLNYSAFTCNSISLPNRTSDYYLQFCFREVNCLY
jgi:hypothetical protein